MIRSAHLLNMTIRNALVTGCDFGLGLEFVRILSRDENIKHVFAGYVNLDKALVTFSIL